MVEIKNVKGHYEVWLMGRFWCSCDNMDEVREELEKIGK